MENGRRDELCARCTRADACHSPFFFGLSMLARTPSPPSYCAPLCDGHFLAYPSLGPVLTRPRHVRLSHSSDAQPLRARTHRFRGEEGERHRLGDASRQRERSSLGDGTHTGMRHGSELQERRGTHGIIMVAAYSSAMRMMHILESQGERCETEGCFRLGRASAGVADTVNIATCYIGNTCRHALIPAQLTPHSGPSSLERTDSTRSFFRPRRRTHHRLALSGGTAQALLFLGDWGRRHGVAGVRKRFICACSSFDDVLDVDQSPLFSIFAIPPRLAEIRFWSYTRKTSAHSSPPPPALPYPCPMAAVDL
ncbi:hypothetical protein DFH08DRAFT_115981 [Mycena albidolilacea]|uniref:Uncharacterized protein n=1 Tax=Mycena albidolilacea TaxID=1033008 RepID=A0AAD7A6R3_9AGAR|nr:hypothetical protein DFH08DRAFT_115981 [Mycena albidolilacea]